VSTTTLPANCWAVDSEKMISAMVDCFLSTSEQRKGEKGVSGSFVFFCLLEC